MEHRDGSCQLCGEGNPHSSLVPSVRLRENVLKFAGAQLPDWRPERPVCGACLNRIRTDLVHAQMEQERDELGKLEEVVRQKLLDREQVAENFNVEYDRQLTLGERIADRMAEFGGSWSFLFVFFGTIAVWVGLNGMALLAKPFDPYPFILLNLVLSLLAAVQAPIIMMSQNRQADRDRLRAESDYKINLKAEVEIRAVNDKMDQLLRRQWVRLLEIQQIQMDMLDDLAGRYKR